MQEKRDNNLFEIKNSTKGRLPSLPFSDIKNRILGKSYSLSLVFTGDALTKKLNRIYRNIDKPTNILSFSLTKDEGEIFINLKRARVEASHFEEKYRDFVGYLFIHGLLHLKGMSHGSTMERQERKLRKQFRI